MSVLPLEGVRVLDFGWVWSGPAVGAILAEFGAEVIKIEHGKRLDSTRLRGRPFINGQPIPGPSIEVNPYFHQINHQKLSLTLDLKKSEARDLVNKLVLISDVVIENLTVGALKRLNLDYPTLSALNEKLIYLSMSAAGQNGPLANMRAYAPIMSSYCGLESLVGYRDESPIGMINFGYGDPNAAIHGLFPLLAALYERETTGRGQWIDSSQFEALLAVLAEPICSQKGDIIRPLSGNDHAVFVPYGIFPCSGEDQWVSVAVTSDEQWMQLLKLMSEPASLSENGLSRCEDRQKDRAKIDALVSEWTIQFQRERLVELLRANGIACSPVLDIPSQWRDPHLRARGSRLEVTHPISGHELLYPVPWKMGDTPSQLSASAPLLGQHNDYVLRNLLKISDEDISMLKATEIVC